MRKIVYLILATVLVSFTGCAKYLNTEPSTSVGSEQVFSSAESALSSLNGIYRAMYMAEWGDNWTHENGGYHAYLLASNLMGDDMIQNASGSGWFFYDYVYWIDGDFTVSYGRQGQTWNFFYQLISNANSIIACETTFDADEAYRDNVLGQAYAIRGMAYMELVQRFSQNDPTFAGVPIYTEPTTIESQGNPRGTVQDVYDRVNEDLDTAIEYLSAATESRIHISHIDLGVAYGLKARYSMVQHNYEDAIEAAEKAIAATSASVVTFDQTSRVNDVATGNVMWGLEIQTDQAATNAGIYYHIDADAGNTYSNGAQFLISKWLYDAIPDTDARKAWWTAPLPEEEWVDGTSQKSYVQVKMGFKDAATSTGDYIIMRAEEMPLIIAEASCHLQDYGTAKSAIRGLVSYRDSDYSRIDEVTESNEITLPLNTEIVTLMDEILFQRRVELWNEVSRMHDLQRLGLGLYRDYEDSNHLWAAYYGPEDYPAACYLFIYSIPQEEFNGNTSLDATVDQNPFE